jgi:hypothetical protein
MPGLAFSKPSITGCIVSWVSQEKKLTVDSGVAAPDAVVAEEVEPPQALSASDTAARAPRAVTWRRLRGALV